MVCAVDLALARSLYLGVGRAEYGDTIFILCATVHTDGTVLNVLLVDFHMSIMDYMYVVE